MNHYEQSVKEDYERKGWTVIRPGWPDLLATRTIDGKIEIKPIEVKGPRDVLRGTQETVLKILQHAGLNAVVHWAGMNKETKDGIRPKSTREELQDYFERMKQRQVVAAFDATHYHRKIMDSLPINEDGSKSLLCRNGSRFAADRNYVKKFWQCEKCKAWRIGNNSKQRIPLGKPLLCTWRNCREK